MNVFSLFRLNQRSLAGQSGSFHWRASGHGIGVEAYITSKSPAAPIPPPMHIVTTTFFAPRRLPSINA